MDERQAIYRERRIIILIAHRYIIGTTIPTGGQDRWNGGTGGIDMWNGL